MSFIGAANPNASSGLKSAPGYRTYQTMTPEGMGLYKQMAQNLGPESYTSRLAGGDQSMFEEMEAPAMRQFQQMSSQNASQFSGMGMGLYKQMAQNLGPESYTSRLAGGDQSMFEEMEAPAMRQFQQMSSQNASQFSGMGMGARRGSGFKNYQNQATSDFAQDLQSRRMELQRQAIMDLSNMSNQLMGQSPYEMFKKREKKPGGWQQMLGLVSPVGGDIASGGETNYTKNFLQMMMGGM